MEKFEIEISLLKDGEVITKRTTENWNTAEANLDSLKRWYQERDAKDEQDLAAETLGK